MFESVGTMVVCVADPKKSYIVGASDEENETFRSKVKNEHLKLPERAVKLTEDSYEKAGISKLTITCENYNDILKITGMPGSCLSDQNGIEVREQVQEIMNDYYSGKINKEEVMSKIKDVCKDMRVYQAQSRHTTGNNKEDNVQILSEIYEVFQKANVKHAAAACFKKGEELAQKNGGTERNNWVYYDSEYYYKSEEIKECLRKAVGELAEEWGADVPNYKEIEENTEYTLDGEMDFNSCWNWMAMQRGNCSLNGFEEVPPKDFSFFYQEIKYADNNGYPNLDGQKGVVQVTCQGKTCRVDVPFNNSLLYGDIKEIFNVKDLLLDNFNEKEFDSNFLSYLTKFDVFTRWYGSRMADLLW